MRAGLIWAGVAVLGGGLGLMPIMTNGLNWLPPHLVGHGGALNNVMQRVASALGVAAMGVLITRESAQLSSDKSALQTSATMPSLVGADQATLAGMHQQVTYRVQALSYADMFIVVALATGVGVLLVLLLRRPPAPGPGSGEVPAPESGVEPPAPASRMGAVPDDAAAVEEPVPERARAASAV